MSFRFWASIEGLEVRSFPWLSALLCLAAGEGLYAALILFIAVIVSITHTPLFAPYIIVCPHCLNALCSLCLSSSEGFEQVVDALLCRLLEFPRPGPTTAAEVGKSPRPLKKDLESTVSLLITL